MLLKNLAESWRAHDGAFRASPSVGIDDRVLTAQGGTGADSRLAEVEPRFGFHKPAVMDGVDVNRPGHPTATWSG